MIRRTFRGIIQILGGLGAGLAVIMVLVSWNLSKGPISLSFLTPYIEKSLVSAHKAFSFRLDDTILTWAGWKRALDIRVVNVRAISADGIVMARIPELSLSLSAVALMRGVAAPKRIELFRPSLLILRRQDGSFEVGFEERGEFSPLVFKGLLAQLLEKPGPERAMSYLSRVNIIDANLTVVDERLKVSWKAPSTQVSFRRDPTGIKGEVSMNLQVEDQETHITLLGGYLAASRRLDLGIAFDEISPVVFSTLVPELAGLSALDVPVQGTATVSLTAEGGVESVGFDLSSGAGSLVLPAPLSQSVEVKGVELSGRYEGKDRKLEIDNLHVDLANGGKIILPGSDGHALPVNWVRMRGRYLGQDDRLEVDTLESNLHGPAARISAIVNNVSGRMAVDAIGSMRDVPLRAMKKYWPAAWGADARKWTTANLSDGVFREISANIGLRTSESGTLEVASLNGSMALENVTVNYLSPMPKVKGLNGKVTYDTKSISIKIDEGHAEGLAVRDGTILISGLDEYDQTIDIDLMIDGSVQDTLALIDHQPLGFVSDLGIDPAETDGTAETNLKLNFILEKALTKDQVKVSAQSTLRGATVTDVVLGLDITGGDLELKADNQGMDVEGEVNFGTIRSTLSWRENFGEGKEFKSRYLIRGDVGDNQRTSELGFDFPPFWGDVVKGTMGANLRFTVLDDHASQLEVNLDLAKVALSLPAVGWSKAVGEPGSAQVDLSLKDKKIKEVSRFTINAADLTVDGSVSYSTEGAGGLKRIDLDRFAYGLTDLKGALIPVGDNDWTVSVHGKSFNLEPLLSALMGEDEDEESDETEAEPEKPRFSLSADVESVWIGPGRRAKSVTGTLINDGEIWKRVRLKGLAGDSKPFEIKIEPTPDGNRKLSVTAADAGAILKTFDIYDNMVGGTLVMGGEFNDKKLDSPLTGALSIEDYRIIKAPTLAHLVSIMALTGILDSLQGDGLGFSILKAPFTFRGGVLEIENARASGLSLGFTASGKIYTHADMMEMKGTIVPAYVINSALGKIPILGALFTGGEEGGGVFASTYTITGPIEDPKVKTNHLTALAPGLLRRLFGGFKGSEEDSAQPEIPDPESTN